MASVDMSSDEEFIELMKQMRYDAAWPWEKLYINYRRRKEGRPPLRSTWPQPAEGR